MTDWISREHRRAEREAHRRGTAERAPEAAATPGARRAHAAEQCPSPTRVHKTLGRLAGRRNAIEKQHAALALLVAHSAGHEVGEDERIWAVLTITRFIEDHREELAEWLRADERFAEASDVGDR